MLNAQVPPEPDPGRHVLRPDRAVGQPRAEAHAHTAHPALLARAHGTHTTSRD